MALRKRFPLHELLPAIKIAKSSYCYQVNALKFDKYKSLRSEVRPAFEESKNRYGYRRIHVVVTADSDGKTISEKVIRQLMKEEELVVHAVNRRSIALTKVKSVRPNTINISILSGNTFSGKAQH